MNSSPEKTAENPGVWTFSSVRKMAAETIYEQPILRDFIDSIDEQNATTIAIISAVAVVLVSILLFLLLRGRKTKKRTLLLTGVSEAGKTALFSQLVYGKEIESYVSIKENSGLHTVKGTGRDVPVIDIPGNERLRLQFWEKFKNDLRAMIFLIDSSRFQKDVKEVAELLYTLLTDPAIHRSKLRLLIACNKQDFPVSKTAKVIQMQLEKEMNMLRVTRAASLETTDSSGKAKEVHLGKKGKNFEFSQLSPMRVEFTQCICKGSEEKPADIGSVLEWIKKVTK